MQDNSMNSILIVDDETKLLEIYQKALEKEGYAITVANNGATAISLLKNNLYDLVITDLRMPGVDGMELFRWIVRNSPAIPVIIITAYASLETAIEALNLGASHYIIKPVKLEELRLQVRRTLEHRRTETENKELKQAAGHKSNVKNIIGSSPSMQEVFARIQKVAGTSTTVLIRGESGTGKELVAQAIHDLSPRKDKAFIKAVCAALPESLLESELFGHVKGSFTGAIQDRMGRFEAADQGTIFLDEIGDIPVTTQIKLLRVLQERQFEKVGDTRTIEVDVRVIAATNQDLEEAMAKKTFREDLYYRLNVVSIFLPPLRSRKEDIPLLVTHFMEEIAKRQGIEKPKLATEALDAMLNYSWPGNIRELENAIEHALVMGNHEILMPEDLPITVQSGHFSTDSAKLTQSGVTLEDMEKQMLISALNQTRHNQSKAAKLLGITRRTLGYRMKKYKIE
jgi:two-component system NtrC family response regulator